MKTSDFISTFTPVCSFVVRRSKYCKIKSHKFQPLIFSLTIPMMTHHFQLQSPSSMILSGTALWSSMQFAQFQFSAMLQTVRRPLLWLFCRPKHISRNRQGLLQSASFQSCSYPWRKSKDDPISIRQLQQCVPGVRSLRNILLQRVFNLKILEDCHIFFSCVSLYAYKTHSSRAMGSNA